MKRLISVLLAVFLLVSLSLIASAVSEQAEYREQMESSGASELIGSLSDEDRESLRALGVEEVDFDTLFRISPRRVFDLISDVVRREYRSPLKAALSAASVLLLLAAAQVFVSDEKFSHTILQLGSVILGLMLAVPLANCIVRLASAVQAQSRMMLALIPVLAVVITLSGNPTLALSYNTMTFAMAQAVVQLVQNTVCPLIRITLSLSLVSSLSGSFGLKQAVAFLKKTGVFLMSLAATIFVTMLVLKSSLASSADTVAVRGVRFLIGRAIPVVGSAVSDAYLSLLGSLNLVKNSAAVFGVIAVLVVALPVVTEGLIWSFALNLLASLAELLGLSQPSDLLRAMSGGLTLLNVTLVLTSVVMVLSIGLIMLIKGGG